MARKGILLSDHFNYRRLLRFTLPTIVMMVFTSIYSVVDGIFISNFVGKIPYAAINFIMPFLMIFGTLGLMVGTGGSALVAKLLGEGDSGKANRVFSMLVAVIVVTGVAISLIGLVFIRDVALWLGAGDVLVEDCVAYATILLPAITLVLLQSAFQAFLVTAERPTLGLAFTVGAGIVNILLDWLFIVVFGWGLKGAAFATVVGQCVGGLGPFVYFACRNRSPLRFTRWRFDGRALWQSLLNGSSEMVTSVSGSVVAMLYNYQLMKYIGEDGVAAFGTIMYVNFIFLGIYAGYSVGSGPIVSYHYGAGNDLELKNLLRRSLVIIGCMAGIITGGAQLLAYPLAKMFVSYDAGLFALTMHAFRLYSLSFLPAGFSIYASSFFTALNNGVISATISFLRTFVFEIGAVLMIPLWLGIDGIWLSVDFAETAALIISIAMLLAFRKRYRY